MIQIDSGFDEILKCDYSLYKFGYLDFKKEVKTWYKEYDLSTYDNRYVGNPRYDADLYLMKQSGLLSNLFFIFNDGSRKILLDGFNRLLTDYSQVDKNEVVYIKELNGDVNLMKVMFNLNLWKLYNKNYGGFTLTDFIDRGFRLFLKTHYNIDLYFRDRNNCDYNERKRNVDDILVLEKYFVNEMDFSADFKYDYAYVSILFSNENIISDFKELLNANSDKNELFKNYNMFLYGYAMCLSSSRIKGFEIPSFKKCLEILKQNKIYFTKLQNMVGNESTRKSIYKFFKNLY